MKKELKVELAQQVKVVNKHQINYPLRGTVIAQTTEPGGLKMSKVRFRTAECWYYDTDLKAVHIKKEERDAEHQRREVIESRGMETVSLQCPLCHTSFSTDIPFVGVRHVPCGNVMCDKAVHVRNNKFPSHVEEVETE